MIDLPIRSCVRPGFVWARRGRGFFATQRLQICGDWILSTQGSPMRGDWILSTQSSPMRGEWIFSTQRLPIPIGRWGTRAETTLLLFHPRCKQNFVVVFVSFFLELESIGTRKFKIVKMRGIYPRCKQNVVVVFVSLFLEAESIGTRKCKIVKMRGILSQVQAEFGRRRRVVSSWARIDRNASI